ncbi:hypothetical protein D3C87_1838770 [compost metagenome]
MGTTARAGRTDEGSIRAKVVAVATAGMIALALAPETWDTPRVAAGFMLGSSLGLGLLPVLRRVEAPRSALAHQRQCQPIETRNTRITPRSRHAKRGSRLL